MSLLPGFHRKNVDLKFHLNYCTPNRIFRGDAPNVAGNLVIKAKKPIRGIVGMEFGFKGEIENFYRHVYVTYSFTMSGAITKVQEHRATRLLFNQKDDLELKGKTELLPTDPPIEKAFNFYFPSDLNLPSSCQSLGRSGDNQGNTTIRYYLYVNIKTKGKIFGDQEYLFPFIVQYQGTSDSFGRDIDKIADQTQIFKYKLKRQIWDESQKQMIPNPIAVAHKHTRGIRQLWNQNYRKTAFDKLARDVPLKCQFIYRENFNLAEPLNDLLKLRFSIPMLKGDWYSANGESTGLGEFVIKELHLKLLHKIILKADYFIYRTMTCDDLYVMSPQDGSYKIDVSGGTESNGMWVQDVSVADLLGKNSTIPLIDELVKPVECTYFLDNFFRTVTDLVFTLKIGAPGLMK